MRIGKLTRSIVVLLACMLFALFAAAQSTTDGAIGGTVLDQTKALVPGAKITVVNTGTNSETSVTSDDFGKFRAIRLQPGSYTVTAESGTFAPAKVTNVIVEIGRVTELELTLTTGSKSEVVEVTGEAPVINTLQQDFSANINQTSINELPINGRRWSNFALLSPGATPDGNYGLISFRGISGLLNNSTVDGGDNNQAFFSEERGRTRISYVISQASVQEFQVNTSNFSAEYGRAAGGVVNAVTKSGSNNIHGTAFYYIRDNELGATNPYTKMYGEPVKPEDRRQQWGGTVGGPIMKDRLFYFFSYDQQKRNYPGVAAPGSATFLDPITVSAPADCAANGLTPGQILSCRGISQTEVDDGLDYLSSLTGVVPRKGDQTIFFPKLDWKITPNHTFTTGYNRMRWNSPAGVQSQPVVSRGISSWGDDYVKVDSFISRLSSAFGSKVSNELRFQYGRDFEYQQSQPPAPGEPTTGVGNRPPSASIGSNSGITIGKPNFLERVAYPDERRTQVANTTTVAHGKHLLKLGADINYVDDTLDNLYQESGAYSYTTLADFLTDYADPAQKRYSSYNQGFGTTRFQFHTWDYALFMQDDFRLTSRLNLNLGIRYERQVLPQPQLPNPALPQTSVFPEDKSNFGPRVGFALDVFGDGKTSLRGGYGLYYGRIINSTISNAITNTSMEGGQTQVQWKPTAAGSPIYPNVVESGSTTIPSDVVVFGGTMRNPQIQQADLIFERDLGKNTVLSLSWIFSHGDGLPNFIDRNLNRPTATTTYTAVGGPLDGETYTVAKFTGARPNTAFGRITNVEGLVKSTYNALVVQVNRRFTNGLQFQNNYTWSHAIDDAQGSQTFTTGNSVLNPYDLSWERGDSNFDYRHRFSSSIVWSPQYFKNDGKIVKALLDNWTISPVISLSVGRPFTPSIGGNVSGGTSTGILGAGGSSRVPELGRNKYHYPRTENVDLRLSRRIQVLENQRVEFLAEAFNLFNRRNITEIDERLFNISGTNLNYNSNFMLPTAAGNTVFRERQVQFAVRYEF